MDIKLIINGFLGAIGYEIRHTGTPTRSLHGGLTELAKHIQVEGIIDIGVAEGTPELYDAFPASRHKYLLVEADPYYKEKVLKLAAKLGGTWEMAFSGAAPSSVKFNIYPDHHKSSLYTNITQKYMENTIDVPVLPLDSMVKTHRFPAPYLVKIDVEGAGLEVLKGATETLTQTKAVVIEAFVGKSFNRAPDFGDLIIFMKERGFSVFDILAGSNRNNTLFQVDLVFINAH